jgi:hypothetical protein
MNAALGVRLLISNQKDGTPMQGIAKNLKERLDVLGTLTV